MKKKNSNSLTNITLAVTWGSVLFTGILIYLFARRVPFPAGSSNMIDPAIFGQLGDVVGGIVGTAAGLLTMYLVLRTYHSQKDELEATQNALYDQRAETSVFAMLSTLREIVNETSGTVTVMYLDGHTGSSEMKGREYIHNVRLDVKRNLAYPTGFNRELMYNPATLQFHIYFQSLTSLTSTGPRVLTKMPGPDSYTVDQVRTSTGQAFLTALKPHYHNFDHYFRYFRNTLEYIASIEYTEDKARYFALVTAQLSQDELVMLFYYTISADTEFRALVDDLGILAPILMPEALFDPWHHWLLPKTRFKFLTNEEWDQKSKISNT
ncbi:putative phage abortive infection protein [Dawidia soli]|uniref:Phage abortive infection protein n=1 Tax=Dawidia soli TaxID=2782352 RepID=A0AAP2DCH8_9BACT|nr:putative phage abortive infection protein [Dawidia soli]MBT1688862.1 hypothetical protein [Dawidia soli]